MPRKDPMTGCMVMTTGEFLAAEAEREGTTPGEILEDIIGHMEKDRQQQENKLKAPAKALEFIKRIIAEENKYRDEQKRYARRHPEIKWETEPPLPLPTWVIKVEEVSFNAGFKDHHAMVVVQALCDDLKHHRIKCCESSFYGGMWDPPDYDVYLEYDGEIEVEI